MMNKEMSKKIKRSMALTLAGAVMMGSLAGCGQSKSDTMYGGYNEPNTSAYTNSATKGDETVAEDYGAYETEEYVETEMVDEALYDTTNSAAKRDNSVEEDVAFVEEPYDSREYNHVAENDFVLTAKEPMSTFAADADTASYSNIRGYLNDGCEVPADSVRIEEMINYFHYDYAEPKAGDPFSVNMEVDNCPWNEDHQLVMVGLKAKSIDMSKRKPTNFVFLIDTSGSMDEANKLPLVKCGFVKLLNELDEGDTVSIVTYAGSDTVVLEGESGRNTDKIASAIEQLYASGSTNGSAGINTAYEIAEKYYKKGGNNRVILATDGDLNVGVTSEDGLTKLIKEKKESGIFLSVLGFGYDNLKDNKLEALADNGNGNYAFVDSVYEAKRILVEEMGATLVTVAKDVKLQAEFDENTVEKYRLIGYENRMMAAEDFDDDSVDGGEIGSGHEVTAIYEIVPAKGAAESGNHIMDLSVRYKEPTADSSKLLKYSCKFSAEGFDNEASDNMRWVESVACLGMVLKNSDYKGTCSIALAKELAGSTRYQKDALKVEYLDLLRQANRIYDVDSDYYYNDLGDDDYDSEDVDIEEIEAD